MAPKPQSFVVFAEMRTGSNFLEANLNAFDGINCHGEAFNPHFMGYPKNEPILGIDLKTRDADPNVLFSAIRNNTARLSGFRYFHDHDPRVFDAIMQDDSCAKIILTRNPVESYVSWKIAQETGQWKLTDVKSHKVAQAQFDGKEFAAHLEALQAFQITLMNRLQTTGQTAFYVAYEDLQSVEVMNGLAKFFPRLTPVTSGRWRWECTRTMNWSRATSFGSARQRLDRLPLVRSKMVCLGG